MLSNRLQDTALRYFLEVVRSGSVSDAAARLNVSPSAVSRQVAGLEEMLGVPLFERRPRGGIAHPRAPRCAGGRPRGLGHRGPAGPAPGRGARVQLGRLCHRIPAARHGAVS
jgi:Bacterial regulatory helix-turn-helix protein, lysR family